jgi:hypothetical protein
MTREELFAQAKKKVEQEKKEKESRGQGNFEFEDKVYVGLEYDKAQLVRILGNPKDARDGDPYSPKTVLTSKILGDNDKNFICNWPLKTENPCWILWKVYDKVMSYKWDKTIGPKGARVYLNEPLHPTIFNRIANNNQTDSTIANGGWKPASYVIMNVIDRHDVAWHKENKHTKLLSKRVSVGKDGRLWPEAGIPDSLYNYIWDKVVESYGDWIDYDIALLKSKNGPLPTDVIYEAYQASTEKLKMPEFKFLLPVKDFIVETPLTDEEKSWERYNIDKLFKITSYQKLLKNLGIFLQAVDAAFKTKFYDELVNLAEQEKALAAEAKEEKAQEPIKESSKVEVVPVKETPKELVSRGAKPVVAPIENKVFDINTLDKVTFKGLTALPPQFKDMIIGIENESGQLLFKPEAGDLLQCDACKTLAPSTFTSCPVCGVTF